MRTERDTNVRALSLLCGLEERDILLEEIVGEIGQRHALLGRQIRKISLNIAVEIDRQIEVHVGTMELAACSAREINLGRNVVVIGYRCSHRLTYRGSSS